MDFLAKYVTTSDCRLKLTLVSVETAGVLRALYSTFTDFWLKRPENSEKSRKRQLLIANASHEGTVVNVQQVLN
jgi:hypothetical protein